MSHKLYIKPLLIGGYYIKTQYFKTSPLCMLASSIRASAAVLNDGSVVYILWIYASSSTIPHHYAC